MVIPIFVAPISCSRSTAIHRSNHAASFCSAAPQKQSPSQPTPPTTPTTPLRTPVHRRLPIIGEIVETFIRNITSIDLARRYGAVYKSDIIGTPVTVITDMAAITTAYRDAETFRSAGAFPDSFTTMLGRNAWFNLDGPAHTASRRRVQPAFSPQLFPLYFPPICTAAITLWTRVSSQITLNGAANLDELMKDHYLRIILHLTTGGVYSTASPLSPDEQRTEMLTLFIKLNAAIFAFPFSRKLRDGLRARDTLIAILQTLLRERLSSRASTIDTLRAAGEDAVVAAGRSDLRTGSLDLLTLLCATSPLQAGPGVVHDEALLRELAQLVMTLWWAGYATQSATTLNAIFEMGFDAAIRQRLIAEQDSIVAACGGEREVTLHQLNRDMPLLDSYLTEVLRMYPPAPGLFRKVAKDTVVCGHEIKKGVQVMFDLWGSQRNEKYYSEPDVLRLDRFVEGDGEGAPKPPGILSFGAVGGGHFCLGAPLARMNIKTTLATLLRDFEFQLDPLQSKKYSFFTEVKPASGVDLIACESRVGRDESGDTE